jgi:hypothetical protein
MKYRAKLPLPKSERMINYYTVTIFYSQGFGGDFTDDLPAEAMKVIDDTIYAEFEVGDDIPWVGETNVCDGHSFQVKVRYTNASESREEVIEMTPERVPG